MIGHAPNASANATAIPSETVRMKPKTNRRPCEERELLRRAVYTNSAAHSLIPPPATKFIVLRPRLNAVEFITARRRGAIARDAVRMDKTPLIEALTCAHRRRSA